MHEDVMVTLVPTDGDGLLAASEHTGVGFGCEAACQLISIVAAPPAPEPFWPYTE